MAVAADPTYPLYSIACILASAMMLLVLLTSFIRQSWNLGVAFLCVALILENLAGGVDAIVWVDNADIKLFVYCDIVSHLALVTGVVKPMATLIITRRLYLITSLQSVELPSRAAKIRDLVIEWTLGVLIPLLVAGPLYYVVQEIRFQVTEGFGCGNAQDSSVLDLLIVQSWSVIPPLVSVTVYYPRVARTFYRQSRDLNRFLQSNDSVSRTNYIRLLVLASVDILLTLPIGIVSIVLALSQSLSLSLPIYLGWTFDHTDWEPEGFSYAGLLAEGTPIVAQVYFIHWTSPVLAFIIFGLFGMIPEARTSYWRVVCIVCGWFGWKPTTRIRRARSPLEDIEFGERSMNLEIGSQPSYINADAQALDHAGIEGEHAPRELHDSSVIESKITEEPRQALSDRVGDAELIKSSSAGSVDAGAM
ncbi:STE3-domain-containing protein [Peniophora sp. CONT]|nr:STE3-domain-containing protein [Peniophora sp. CONT]